MRFSVIVCTYNQASSLSVVLAGLERQQFSDGEYELVVVDNNSSDRTRQVCEDAFKRIAYPAKYVFEGHQGLSVARNRGVAEASGDIIIFTDDDARLPPDWLQNYATIYNEYGADCVYGRITVDWERGQPDWYSDNFKAMFVALDYGQNAKKIVDYHHEFYGKNFSVRKEVLLALGGFDEKLGRIGSRLFLGEETRIYKGLVSGGYVVIYAPILHVAHMLKDYEYTEAHCLKHVRDATISEYYMMSISDGHKLFGRPLYALKKAFLLAFCAFKALLKKGGIADYAIRFHSIVMLKKSFQLLQLWLKGKLQDH